MIKKILGLLLLATPIILFIIFFIFAYGWAITLVSMLAVLVIVGAILLGVKLFTDDE